MFLLLRILDLVWESVLLYFNSIIYILIIMNISSNNSEKSFEELDIYRCTLVQFSKTHQDCSRRFPNRCFDCPIIAGYLLGDNLDDYLSPGHLTCIIVMLTVVLISSMGVLWNILIMVVVHKKRSRRSFDYLVSVLALFDLLTIITCTMCVIVLVSIFGKQISKKSF